MRIPFFKIIHEKLASHGQQLVPKARETKMGGHDERSSKRLRREELHGRLQ